MTGYRHPHGHVFYRKMLHERPKIARAEGVYLYDESGKRYLDGSGGPFVINIGHGRREVVEAMREQAYAADYVHATMFTSDVLETYAERLAGVVPLMEPRFFFMSSGSEAAEAAIKLARQIQQARGEHGRYKIISRNQSYHGMSFGALSVSGRKHLKAPYVDMMAASLHVSPPYPYRDERTGKEYAAELEALIQAEGVETVAAFVAEPISGAGLGACLPPDDYWHSIAEVCARHGVLLVIDEVFTGMGRTGKWWGIDHWNVVPDILFTSKGIAGGYFPLAMITTHGKNVDLICEQLGDFNHGGTFSHHPIGMAVGLATLDVIQRENLVDQSTERGTYLGEQLHAVLGNHPHVGEIRGRGLCWGVELVKDRETKAPYPASQKIAPTVWHNTFDRGVSLYYAQGCADGTNGDVILIGPPFIINTSEIDVLVETLSESILEVC